MSFSDCRFYEAELPEIDQIVKVQVKRIAEMGAYVSLLEYNNIEGMILLSELSKRRIRSISKLIRVGRTEIVLVLRVDKDKSYIDLSKKMVLPEDRALCEEKVSKSKCVHSIMRHVASQFDLPLKQLCQQIAWPLYAKYGHAYDAFKQFSNDDEDIFSVLTLPPDKAEEIKECVKVQIGRRLLSQLIRLRAKIDVSCFEYEGIDAIKDSLLAGLKCTSEDCELSIKYISPPQYALVIVCNDKDLGMKRIDESMDIIKKKILGYKGTFIVRSKPELIGADDKIDEESGSEDSKSGSDDESDQDESMGKANFDEAELKKKTGDIKSDDEKSD
jgi:translation initiation factor 2 subunit 1